MNKLLKFSGLGVLLLLISGSLYIWNKYWIPREYVFSSNQAEAQLKHRNIKTNYWSPGNSTIVQFKKLLQNYLQSNEIIGKEKLDTLDSYNYQYYGVIYNEDKYLKVIAICTGLEILRFELSLDQLVDMIDGGPCFSDVTFNVTKNHIDEVFVHG